MWHTFVVSTVIQMFTNVIFVTLPSLRRILTCFSPQEFCYSCRGPWVLLVLWFALYTLSTYMHFDWYWDTALCVYDIIVCALNITKDCGADQLDHEEDPVVCAVVLNQHQQYTDIEYGTNRQHDITSTYRYWICHKPSPTVHGYAANHYNDYTATPLLGVILWTQANPRQGKGSPESSETAQDVTHQWF